MQKKKPDPDGFRSWVRDRTDHRRDHIVLGDNMQLAKVASRHCISSETARGILKEEGWTMERVGSGVLRAWRPPQEEGEDG
jgi:hypothetical protein